MHTNYFDGWKNKKDGKGDENNCGGKNDIGANHNKPGSGFGSGNKEGDTDGTKKKKGKDVMEVSFATDIGVDGKAGPVALSPPVVAAIPGPPVEELAPQVASAGRVPADRPSRERSPRRMSPSPALPHAVRTPPILVGFDGFSIGQAVCLQGLVWRPEPAGQRAIVLSFDEAAGRCAVKLATSGE